MTRRILAKTDMLGRRNSPFAGPKLSLCIDQVQYIVQVAGAMKGKSLSVKEAEEMFIILYPVPAQTHKIDTIKVRFREICVREVH